MTTTTARSASELEEMLSDGTVAKMFEGGKPTADFGTFIRDYATALQGEGTELAAQVREETQRVLAEWLREHEAEGVRRVNLAPGKSPAGKTPSTPEAPGARVDELFDSHAEFLRATWYRNQDPKALDLQDKLREVRNAYGSTIPADGGFLIPETLRSNLLQVALEMAVVRPRATVIPMESLRVPFPTIDETSHASSVYGGMVGYWTEEAGALTTSSAKFGRVVLEAKKLTGYSEVPNELFSDSIISFQAFLSQVWPRAIAWFEDVAFMRGSGVGEPLGWLNAEAAVSATRTASGADIEWADIAAMYSRMLPGSLGSAVWIAHIDTFPSLATMQIGSGPALVNGYGGGAGQFPMTILGRPVIFTEKANSSGTSGDINFVDLSYYLIGDRQAMSMESSPHYKFANDQTAVRIIERVDGLPWLKSPITPQTGSNTLSPFVKLT